MIVYQIFPLERGELYPVDDQGKSGNRNDCIKVIKTSIRDGHTSACTYLLSESSLTPAMRTPDIFGNKCFRLARTYLHIARMGRLILQKQFACTPCPYARSIEPLWCSTLAQACILFEYCWRVLEQFKTQRWAGHMYPSIRRFASCFLKLHLLEHQLYCPWPAQFVC